MDQDHDNESAQRDYLNAPDTAGRPMSLVSLILTFLLIAAIALLLFVAGRWAYSAVTGNKDTADNTSQENSSQGADGDASNEGDANTTDEGTANGDGSSNTEQGGDSSSSNEGAAINDDASQNSDTNDANDGSSQAIPGDSPDSSTATTDNGSSSDSTISTTGPSATNDLPNTGPESLVALFIGTIIVSAFAHKLYVIKK